MQKGTTINWYRHVTELYFGMSEIDIKSPAGSIIVGAWKKFWFFHPQDCWKMHLSRQGKYPIVNKSTTFAFFCYPYLKPLHIFLQETQQWIVSKFLFPFFFFQENQNPGKNQKNHKPIDRTSFTSIWKGWFSFSG